MLVSHPDRSLITHLEGLQQVIDAVLQEKAQKLYPAAVFEELLRLLVIYHDIAKSTDYFQHKIISVTVAAQTDFYFQNQVFLDRFLSEKEWVGKAIEEDGRLTRHGELGAYLIQAEWIEETLNLDHLILLQIIKKHHGNLQSFQVGNFCFADTPEKQEQRSLLIKRFEALPVSAFVQAIEPLGRINEAGLNLERILAKFMKSRKVRLLLNGLEKAKEVVPFLKTIFLYSILLSADKGDVKLKEKASVFIRKQIPSHVVDDFKRKFITSEKAIDGIRQEAYQTVLDNLERHASHFFFSITLPTGMGKTFSVYKAALWLKEHCFPKHRIIYCLPFTSIIDQNAALFEAILNHSGIDLNCLTIHHYLTQIRDRDQDGNEIDQQLGEYVTEGWQNEIIVTTFVQLLESVFTNRNKRLRKFHNLANSIIILDEVQGIHAKYYEVIEQVFEKMAELFNTRFFFVTATQPMLLAGKVTELAAAKGYEDAAYFFNQMNRIQLDQRLLRRGKMSVEAIADELIKGFRSGHSVLGIFNLVRQSQEAYDAIKKMLPGVNIRYLSAAQIPFCRKSIIRQVKNDLKAKRPQILISTQVVEAGVDIDFDHVFRDFATLDSINQSAGRCNRNSEKGIGTVSIFNCGESKRIYDPVLLSATREVLDAYPEVIAEKDIYSLNKHYFKLVKKRVQDGNDHSRLLLRMIHTLQFEELDDTFEFIPYDFPKYSVFIPLNRSARKVWRDYVGTWKIENRWDRKAAVKKLMPSMLQYVVAIPEQHYQAAEKDKEKILIYESDWRSMYSLETGYLRGSTPVTSQF